MPSLGYKRWCTAAVGALAGWCPRERRGAQTATDELLLDEFYFSLLRQVELGIHAPHLLLENRELEWLAAPPRVVLPKAATALGVVVP